MQKIILIILQNSQLDNNKSGQQQQLEVVVDSNHENNINNNNSIQSISSDLVEFERLTKQLEQSDETINDLKAEVNKLRVFVDNLKLENNELKCRLSQQQQRDENMLDSPICRVGMNGAGGDSGFESFVVCLFLNPLQANVDGSL